MDLKKVSWTHWLKSQIEIIKLAKVGIPHFASRGATISPATTLVPKQDGQFLDPGESLEQRQTSSLHRFGTEPKLLCDQ